ncbi:MAG: radical SAM protein [Bacteroidaceae bacterium]|nr:radical SAM protein [Bacteroidaceae bacterium]
MKESKYNYYITENGKGIIFNGITKRFFVTSLKTKSMYETILHSPNDFVPKYEKFLNKMKAEGFVLDDEEDEYKIVMDNYKQSMLPDTYRLMILPTFKCNLSCWYCIQEHTGENMSDDTVLKVKKHIRKYLVENNIKNFRISWFGGEPLVMYNTVYDISTYAKQVCNELGVDFWCDITTNSLLLNKERLRQLNECNVKHFQITIDGTREEHNKVKHVPHKDTFTMDLNNIKDILDIIPDCSVTLRINYSNKMKNPPQIIDEVSEILTDDYRQRLTINIQKVWQERDEKSDEQPFENLAQYSKNKGFNTTVVRHGKCYVDNKHYNTILPDGRVDICDHEGRDVIGRAFLTEDGDIKWEEKLKCFQYSIINENVICNKCKHMPLCGGLCPAKRNEFYGKKVNKLLPCPSDDMDKEIERDIRHYVAEFGI